MRAHADRAQAKIAESSLSPDEARLMMDAVIALRFLDTEFREGGGKVLTP